MTLNIREKGYTTPKDLSDCKSEKYETFCVSQLLIWRQKWVAGVEFYLRRLSHEVRRLSPWPGRIIDVLF